MRLSLPRLRPSDFDKNEGRPGVASTSVGMTLQSRNSNHLGLEVANLRKSYGDLLAVDDLSFQVAPGEVFGLIGPNGAGKSTCMLLIIGLLKPDAGTITFDGKAFDPRDAGMRSRLGVVPQELAIYPELTAYQNLSFFGGLYGLRGRRLKERVDYILDLTGLTKSADLTPSTFSGGMCRRLNFGTALLHEPQFVILDEPTVGIDPQSRSSLLDCVRGLSQKGVGVVYASHYMEEVEAVCHRVAIIDHGRLLKQGTLDELLDRTRIELCVRVKSIPSDLQTRLREAADLIEGKDGETQILIRETEPTQKEVHPVRIMNVLELLEQSHVPILGIETHETSLETLFLRLTGRKLRD
jgi:ABC-2 type transport system ATP-binding protein